MHRQELSTHNGQLPMIFMRSPTYQYKQLMKIQGEKALISSKALRFPGRVASKLPIRGLSKVSNTKSTKSCRVIHERLPAWFKDSDNAVSFTFHNIKTHTSVRIQVSLGLAVRYLLHVFA